MEIDLEVGDSAAARFKTFRPIDADAAR